MKKFLFRAGKGKYGKNFTQTTRESFAKIYDDKAILDSQAESKVAIDKKVDSRLTGLVDDLTELEKAVILNKIGANDDGTDPVTEWTYSELMALKDSGGLISGGKYLMTDYLHKYFIEGSDSAGKKTFYGNYGNVSGWGVIYGYYPELTVGTEVTITYLPDGYAGAIQVGDKTTVTQTNQDWYFKYANGLQWVINAEFSTATDRYQNIAQDIVVNDINGRPVIRPGGIINTEVHDGAAYMEMTAAENHAVVPEQLILTADSTGSFSSTAKSKTYSGDVVEFYYDNASIYNDNGELISTRNGQITKRTNEWYQIDLPLDWRAQRYRRWCLNLDSRTKFINQNLDPATTRIGYQGKFLFTSSLRAKENLTHFFIGKLPEGSMMCLDENAMKIDFLFEAESIAYAKDYPVFPLDVDLNPVSDVSVCKIKACTNTVFQLLSGDQSPYISVEARAVTGSTLVSQFTAYDKESIDLENVVALDYLKVGGSDLDMENINVLSRLDTLSSVNTKFQSSIFGTMQNGVRIDGYSELPTAWWGMMTAQNSYIRNSVFSSVLAYTYVENTRVINSSFFFYHSFNEPSKYYDGQYKREVIKLASGIYSNVGLRITGICDRLFFTDLIFSDTNPDKVNGLYLYDFNTSLANKAIKKYDTNDQLYFETKSPSGTTVTTADADGTSAVVSGASFVSDYRIKDTVLAQADWVLNGTSGLYEYTFAHALITTSTEVDITPDIDSLSTAIDAKISSYTTIVDGSVMLYAEVQPALDITTNILISKVQDV